MRFGTNRYMFSVSDILNSLVLECRVLEEKLYQNSWILPNLNKFLLRQQIFLRLCNKDCKIDNRGEKIKKIHCCWYFLMRVAFLNSHCCCDYITHMNIDQKIRGVRRWMEITICMTVSRQRCRVVMLRSSIRLQHPCKS